MKLLPVIFAGGLLLSSSSASAADAVAPAPGEQIAAQTELIGVSKPWLRPGFTVTALPESGYALSGHVADPSAAGRTGAICFRVPDSFEQAASGKIVRIEVEAISDMTGEARIGLVYSTNEMGNSSWRVMPLDPLSGRAGFLYNVPDMRDGKGDFIGVQPDPDNKGQTLTLTSITLRIIDAG